MINERDILKGVFLIEKLNKSLRWKVKRRKRSIKF